MAHLYVVVATCAAGLGPCTPRSARHFVLAKKRNVPRGHIPLAQAIRLALPGALVGSPCGLPKW